MGGPRALFRRARELLRVSRRQGSVKRLFHWALTDRRRLRQGALRVHGPTFVIEYVNVQDGANHSHVLRDFANDFGRDWLADHLERDHASDR